VIPETQNGIPTESPERLGIDPRRSPERSGIDPWKPGDCPGILVCKSFKCGDRLEKRDFEVCAAACGFGYQARRAERIGAQWRKPWVDVATQMHEPRRGDIVKSGRGSRTVINNQMRCRPSETRISKSQTYPGLTPLGSDLSALRAWL